MEDTKTEFLDEAKLLLGIEDEAEDRRLSVLIDDTVNAVLSYCRIDTLPRQLEGLVPQIAVQLYQKQNVLGIKTISEGERRVEYADAEGTIMSAYHDRLKPFVSRRVYVPSERNDKNERV